MVIFNLVIVVVVVGKIGEAKQDSNKASPLISCLAENLGYTLDEGPFIDCYEKRCLCLAADHSVHIGCVTRGEFKLYCEQFASSSSSTTGTKIIQHIFNEKNHLQVVHFLKIENYIINMS